MRASSACPLRVATIVWQSRPGSFALTVVCKATYALAPGISPLAPIQDEPNPADVFWSDDPGAGLRLAGDLAPFKRRADVLLVGHAYAPAGQPVTALVARLVAAGIDKEIAVHGDRFFTSDGRLGAPAAFTAMPLRWERAAGGPGTPNPVGVRIDAPPDGLGRVLVPNLQRPGERLERRGGAVEPVGFGPVAPGWPRRLAYLRQHAASWDAARWHEGPLPEGLDAGYFNAAPQDQQAGDLPPDAHLVLTNLLREHAQLVTTLQPIAPRAVYGAGSTAQEIRLRCDTLCIDTDRALASLVWRGVFPLEHAAQAGQIVISTDAPLAALPSRPASVAATVTFDLSSVFAAVTLPFAAGSTLPSAASPPSPPGLPGLARAHARFGGTADLDPAMIRAALPFAGATGAPGEPPLPDPRPAPPDGRDPAESLWARGGTPVAPLAIAPAPAAPLPAAARPDPAPVVRRTVAADPLHLVWFSRDVVPALRKDPRWSPLLDALDDRAVDADLDDPDLAADVADLDERREVFEILARGSAVDEEGVSAALAAGVRADGGFVQPLVLLAGELALPLDELQALKAMMSAAAPYVTADPEARAIVAAAREFLGSPGQPSAPAVAEGLTTRIRETFEKRSLVPAGFLDAQAARALLRGRHHQLRRLLGGPHLRGIWNPGVGPGIPAYLDRRGAAKLPAGERHRARMLAFVHPTLDQNETHPAALRVVALALALAGAPLARR